MEYYGDCSQLIIKVLELHNSCSHATVTYCLLSYFMMLYKTYIMSNVRLYDDCE